MIVATRKTSRIYYPSGASHASISSARQSAGEDLDEAWLGYSIKIESLLRAYFNSQVLRAFEHYDLSIGYLNQLAAGELLDTTARDLHHQFGVDMGMSRDLVDYERNGSPAAVMTTLQGNILGEEDKLVASIFAAHVTGYSTTTHDLIHDLIP